MVKKNDEKGRKIRKKRISGSWANVINYMLMLRALSLEVFDVGVQVPQHKHVGAAYVDVVTLVWLR